jgi:hypothetical protein
MSEYSNHHPTNSIAVNPDQIRARSPLLIIAVGTLLLVTGVVHHSQEIAAVGGVTGPALALGPMHAAPGR